MATITLQVIAVTESWNPLVAADNITVTMGSLAAALNGKQLQGTSNGIIEFTTTPADAANYIIGSVFTLSPSF